MGWGLIGLADVEEEGGRGYDDGVRHAAGLGRACDVPPLR
jgi:hypothetical protein